MLVSVEKISSVVLVIMEKVVVIEAMDIVVMVPVEMIVSVCV